MRAAAATRLAPGTPAAWTPNALPNLILWLAAYKITGLNDGDAVASWVDSSPSATPLTQATSTKRPIYRSTSSVTAIPNGQPVVQFDGVDDWLSATTTAFGTSLSLLAVLTPSSVASTYPISGTGPGSGPAIISNFSSKAFEMYMPMGTTDRQTFATSASGFHMLSLVRNGSTNTTGWFDGTQAFSITPASTLSGYRVNTVGAAYNSGTQANFADTKIAELIICNGALSTSDRTAAESYLRTRYGTP